MRDHRKMIESGVSAMMIKLMENEHKPPLDEYSLPELRHFLLEEIEELEEELEPRDKDIKIDYLDILREAADCCNYLFGIIWYCEKILKIEDGKRRKDYVKKVMGDIAEIQPETIDKIMAEKDNNSGDLKPSGTD